MQRKLMLFSVLVILSLIITPIGAAKAQGPLPPPPPVDETKEPVTDWPTKNPFRTYDLSENIAPAAVGASGTSFRYLQTFGTTSVPYLADNSHLNRPRGVFVDTGDNLFVAETEGSRVLKFDSSGNSVLTLGYAGQPWSHDDFLSYARDVAVRASDGHIWVIGSPMLKEFDSSGVWVQTFPDPNPWETGSDNAHFNDPWGVAFGAGGYLYVADSGNHRIQVFDISGAAPVYVTTVGTTSVTQTDNTGFDYPKQIAFDSLNQMYVMDLNNFRVQRCTSSSPWTTWTCSTFFGGVQGNDLTHMSYADGIGIDASDNIYIADGSNARVLKCNTSAVCAEFAGINGVTGSDNAHFIYPDDVAIDSSGNVYVSDPDNDRVQKFNSAGVYLSTIGVTKVPYLTDGTHINTPWGIALAPDGGFYVTERSGYRLIKMDASGIQQWTVGEAGVYGNDNAHFGDWWGGLEGSPAVDASGRVYVGDTANHRVQIFNSNGSYYATLGTGWGMGNYEFDCPTEVAISPANGDIYVLDRCNQRVQVFTSSLTYKATLGATGTSGSDNLHFNWPWGVTVDGSGNIYVADSDNHRIQKCVLITSAPGYSCSTFAGVSGVSGWDLAHFAHPLSVELDSAGRVYVADEWNSRIQVFDSNGAYLTTIAGNWGTTSGDTISPSGVVVDNSGNVYVTDRENHRIQKFALGTPNWVQSNVNGFGDLSNGMAATLTTFNNQLYAGTLNSTTGGQLWRSGDGISWSSVMTNGFGDNTNLAIDHLFAFNGQLYAGTWNWDNVANQTTGGQLWRSADGTTWSQLTLTGFDPLTNSEFFHLASFNGQIYASTWADGSTHGGEIWRSATGNSSDWTQVENNGFGDINNVGVLSFAGFNNNFYASTDNWITGAEVWRSPSGNAGTWTQVNTDGFGDSGNYRVSALTVFGSYLYAATGHDTSSAGSEVWRCQVCDGSDWAQVVDNAFGNPGSGYGPALEISNGRLYLVLGNYDTGIEVWRTTNGTVWEQAASGGFGSKNTRRPYYDNSVTSFGGSLYVGTINWVNGGQIWRDTFPASFTDVSKSYWAWSWIERLYAAGVTSGCATGLYCPENSVTRAQMAIFLLKGAHGSAYTPPAVGTGTGFTDVATNYWAAAWIKQLAAEGITAGCGTGIYCPENPVTRAQMAVFLLKSEHGTAYSPPDVGAGTGFTDVPADYWAAAWIKQLAAEGITSGCGAGVYCPESPVTRAQMAVFLVKTFNLP
ncbi:MAG: S-layer homology domain-containing protein [Chloroflexi bacterium]|nr:S-layer homology domain-containing protein [Chloroflexota bacterium]